MGYFQNQFLTLLGTALASQKLGATSEKQLGVLTAAKALKQTAETPKALKQTAETPKASGDYKVPELPFGSAVQQTTGINITNDMRELIAAQTAERARVETLRHRAQAMRFKKGLKKAAESGLTLNRPQIKGKGELG